MIPQSLQIEEPETDSTARFQTTAEPQTRIASPVFKKSPKPVTRKYRGKGRTSSPAPEDPFDHIPSPPKAKSSEVVRKTRIAAMKNQKGESSPALAREKAQKVTIAAKIEKKLKPERKAKISEPKECEPRTTRRSGRIINNLKGVSSPKEKPP
jgi:hypothetical protein